MEAHCVLCEMGTDSLYMIQIYFRLCSFKFCWLVDFYPKA